MSHFLIEYLRTEPSTREKCLSDTWSFPSLILLLSSLALLGIAFAYNALSV